MKINFKRDGFFDPATVTETVNPVELLVALAHKNPISLHLLDGSGYGERFVSVLFVRDEYVLVDRECDDTEDVYSFRTTSLSEAWSCLKNYALQTALKPSEKYM